MIMAKRWWTFTGVYEHSMESLEISPDIDCRRKEGKTANSLSNWLFIVTDIQAEQCQLSQTRIPISSQTAGSEVSSRRSHIPLLIILRSFQYKLVSYRYISSLARVLSRLQYQRVTATVSYNSLYFLHWTSLSRWRNFFPMKVTCQNNRKIVFCLFVTFLFNLSWFCFLAV